jgi:hypothetical protein
VSRHPIIDYETRDRLKLFAVIGFIIALVVVAVYYQQVCSKECEAKGGKLVGRDMICVDRKAVLE